ncbi:MAG: polysaccharide biosynthesis protein [Clostridia bacterium]|nr:polysaccharide biosynthesis protein [Clostridia bacterium]
MKKSFIKTNISRILVLLSSDLAVVAVSYGLALLLAAFRSEIPSRSPIYLLWLAIPLVVYAACLCVGRVNRTIWRYASGKDFFNIALISLIAAITAFLANELAFQAKNVPVVYGIMAGAAGTYLIVLSRLTYFVIVAPRATEKRLSGTKRLLIVGAGEAGAMMLNEILHNPSRGIVPVAMVDDSDEKQQRSMSGIQVCGYVSDIERVCREKAVDLIYVAIPSASNTQRAKILEECAKTHCPVKILPFFSELVNSGSLADKVRNITPEELLGREPITVADNELLSFVSGKTVVITGGGGSIGSELCRQIAAHSPGKLVIIDIYENNAYDIQQELIRKYGAGLNMQVHIASIRDAKKMDYLFALERPDIVIHAAAHKHVPLMEDSPEEAVKNNIFGLFNTAVAADKNGVSRFILISTDKAVNPTNVMGATKRVCEMLITYFSKFSGTTFTAVRFGNVLGSNGSVIPLFKAQIEAGQDVTVTHPEMIRYFMTIPEASQLVLASGAMAKSGEIFVLDMGEPVKIDDLAKKMISLSGLTLGWDINIRYTGLRPGEKMYEELLMSEEGLSKTANKKIFIGRAIDIDPVEFARQLACLKDLCELPEPDHDRIRIKLREFVPSLPAPDVSAEK